jgi:hypothetical protein
MWYRQCLDIDEGLLHWQPRSDGIGFAAEPFEAPEGTPVQNASEGSLPDKAIRGKKESAGWGETGTTGIKFDEQSHTLICNAAWPAGDYALVCAVRNEEGWNISRRVQLMQYFLPRVVAHPPHTYVEVTEGQNLKLPCETAGTGPLTHVWVKDTTPLRCTLDEVRVSRCTPPCCIH